VMISCGRVWKSRTVRHRQIKVSVALLSTANKHSTYSNSAPWIPDLELQGSGCYISLWTRLQDPPVLIFRWFAGAQESIWTWWWWEKSLPVPRVEPHPSSLVASHHSERPIPAPKLESTSVRFVLCSVSDRWSYIQARNKNYSCKRPWRPIGLWDVEVPTFSR
jgi:hypothetical protein